VKLVSTDSTFIASADATLAAIGTALDVALAGRGDGDDDGTDWSLNRHVPNREIWVAARSGGFHFRADAGTWRDSRSGGELAAQLTLLLRDQAGLVVDLTGLPPPAI